MPSGFPSKKPGKEPDHEPDAPKTVQEYAQARLRICLDPSAPAVLLTSIVGVECRSAIDGAAALQTACALYLGEASAEVRYLVRAILTTAIKSADRVARLAIPPNPGMPAGTPLIEGDPLER
jgi:hypothetical protein